MAIFTGMDGFFGKGSAGTIPQYVPTPKLIVGHVLEVCLNADSPLYKGTDENIGAIRFRDVFGPPTVNIAKEDGTLAYPADRTNLKLPLPGEQVIIYTAYSDKVTPTNNLAPGYFYAGVITNTANVTSNSSPFVGISPTLLKPGLKQATYAQVEKRFDKRIQNLENFKDATSNFKPVVHKQLRPFEGDYIIQGRYGNSIRFGGTPTDRNADAGPIWGVNRRGKPGDSIIVMRLSNETIKANQVKNKLYDIEDINEDAASIYMTTTQEVPMKLAVPDKGQREHPLASWAYTYGISSPNILPSETHMFDGEAARDGADKKSEKIVTDPKDFKTASENAQNNPTATGNPTNTNVTNTAGGGNQVNHSDPTGTQGLGQSEASLAQNTQN
jgi:hypothetical protein